MTSKYLAIPFKPGHLDFMSVREHELELISRDRFTSILMTAASIVTFIVEGRILMVAGFWDKWGDGSVLDIFILPSTHIIQYKKTFYQICKEYMSNLVKLPGIHRIESFSRSDPSTDIFMGHLEFLHEGTHRQFTANKVTYKSWARTIE